MKNKNRVGEININKYNSKMTIIKYNNAHDVMVEFENGYKVKTEYKHFKNGGIQNVYDKTICDIGFIGEGKYNTTEKINEKYKPTKIYDFWRNMLKRCYDEKTFENHPTYKGCTVCEEWHNFQTFAKWFDENYYEIDGEKMCLDKDILFKGNKVYSPEDCVFVPNRINGLFTKRQNDRGEYPIGVTKDKNKFKSTCSIITKENKTKNKNIGRFNTPEEAFYEYKTFKEDYIKQVADEYKDKIPLKLYDAMYRYIVEITD